ncbi:MAG TPA: EI24 domain-containing protein [Kofleriaceae bacterium]|nr:EI24 domain-containing protein [Kofleriaceae bacterium]
MRDFARGTGDLSRGLAVVNRYPGLWKWLLAPALVSLVLIGAAIAGIAHVVHPLVAWLVGHLPSFLAGIAGTLLTVIVVAMLGLGALLVFTAVAGVIAGPFNELLSERIEAHLTGRPAPAFSLPGFLHELSLGIVHGVRRVIIAILGAVVVLAIGFVPVVGTVVALALGFWFAARGAAYDCYDAVLARRALAYRDKLAYLARHRARSLGLGAAVAALLLVPGLNLVALGLGAAGATVASLDS